MSYCYKWLLAFRPKTLTAAIVPIIVATALVYQSGAIIYWHLSILALLSALFIQIGTNLVNDAIDFMAGVDTDRRIGPDRITQSGLVTPKRVIAVATLSFLIAAILGIPLVFAGGWPILLTGVLAIAFGILYTASPWALSYRGISDIFVIIFFGIVAVSGVFFLHTQFVSLGAIICGIQLGCLATVLLAINNLRDIEQDRVANKKTLAVRFGERFVKREIIFLLGAPYLLNFYWLVIDSWPIFLLPIITIPVAFKVGRNVFTNVPSPKFNLFLGQAALLHLVFGLTLTIGMICERFLN